MGAPMAEQETNEQVSKGQVANVESNLCFLDVWFAALIMALLIAVRVVSWVGGYWVMFRRTGQFARPPRSATGVGLAYPVGPLLLSTVGPILRYPCIPCVDFMAPAVLLFMARVRSRPRILLLAFRGKAVSRGRIVHLRAV